jgi:exodeoxyribonuclease III
MKVRRDIYKVLDLNYLMKIVSWNVNGIRAVLNKGFLEFVRDEEPDILCLQEVKANVEQVDEILKEYEHHLWNSADRKGYSGTAIFSKIKPKKVKYGKDIMDDDEGRIIAAEFEKYFLVNVYTPNSKRGLERLDYRQRWDKKFFEFLKELEKEKPVILCGDLNVAHKEIDLARPKENMMNAGFTNEEREGFERFVGNGFIDAFRLFNKNPGKYTWWSYMFKARERNVGWRIDYFLTSHSMNDTLEKCEIMDNVFGSDHCPIKLELKK